MKNKNQYGYGYKYLELYWKGEYIGKQKTPYYIDVTKDKIKKYKCNKKLRSLKNVVLGKFKRQISTL